MIDARSWVTNPAGNWVLDENAVIGIAIHHSVTNTRSDVDPRIEQLAIQAIDTYHVQQNYGGIGYHGLAFPSGRRYQVGTFNGARSGVAFRNHELVHLCAIGTYTDVLPPPEVLDGLAEMIVAVRTAFGRSLEVRGHNQWAVPGQGTICAGKLNGFDWPGYLAPQRVVTPGDVAMACQSAGHFYRMNYDFGALLEGEKEILRMLARKV